MKASKSRRAAPVRIVAVAAPVGWDRMFKKDPEGPEIQAFLSAALAQAEASPQRAPKPGNTTSAAAKEPNNVRGKRGATTDVVKSRKKHQKRK